MNSQTHSARIRRAAPQMKATASELVKQRLHGEVMPGSAVAISEKNTTVANCSVQSGTLVVEGTRPSIDVSWDRSESTKRRELAFQCRAYKINASALPPVSPPVIMCSDSAIAHDDASGLPRTSFFTSMLVIADFSGMPSSPALPTTNLYTLPRPRQSTAGRATSRMGKVVYGYHGGHVRAAQLHLDESARSRIALL